MVFAYAHDEYLQVLAELGVIGLALLLAGLAALLRVPSFCGEENNSATIKIAS